MLWNSGQVTFLSQSSSTSHIMSSMSLWARGPSGALSESRCEDAAVDERTRLHLWPNCLKMCSTSSASMAPSLQVCRC